MHYVAKFERDGDGYLVTFPAVPEAITGGATREEAFINAIDALEVALLTYAKDKREMPAEVFHGEKGALSPAIPVSATVSAKIAFIEAFQKSGLTRTALAERLGKGETEVRRMLDPYYGTKLPALEEAMHALGKRFVLTVEEAA